MSEQEYVYYTTVARLQEERAIAEFEAEMDRG